MAEKSKIEKDLERLKGQIRTSEKKLKETLKKAENLRASIRAEIRSLEHAKNRRKIK
jgi:hypothetical protein